MLKRLKVIRHFSFKELIILFCGRVLSISNAKLEMIEEKADNIYLLVENVANLKSSQQEVIFDCQIDAEVYSLQLRINGSDILVYNQVLIHKAYEYLVRLYDINFNESPKRIVDAGANVGLTTIYLKTKYPESTVFLIEPVQANITLAERNVAVNMISSVIFFNGALWPKEERLIVINDFRDQKDWSLRVQENTEGNIKSVTPLEVIRRLDGVIDIFKIDIEGSESQIFNKEVDLTWLSLVKVIAIEIHDEFIVRNRILNILQENNFELTSNGELIIGVNKDYE